MKRFILMCMLAVLVSMNAAAQSAEEIVKKADEAFTGNRVYSESTLTIHRSGRTLPVQEMESYGMEIGDDYHSLSIYRAPARMKGTAYLMIGDDLWVRFSSTGRIRKLSSSAKKNAAGGSDFSYADMGEGDQGIGEKYVASMAGEEKVDGSLCFVVELKPKPGRDAPYEKVLAYVERETFRYLKVEYFDAGANIKTMYLSDYRNVDGRDYPYIVKMRSNTKDSRTVVETTKIEFDSSRVNRRLFSTTYLESIR